jgi:hypothetical protein
MAFSTAAATMPPPGPARPSGSEPPGLPSSAPPTPRSPPRHRILLVQYTTGPSSGQLGLTPVTVPGGAGATPHAQQLKPPLALVPALCMDPKKY